MRGGRSIPIIRPEPFFQSAPVDLHSIASIAPCLKNLDRIFQHQAFRRPPRMASWPPLETRPRRRPQPPEPFAPRGNFIVARDPSI